MATFKETMRSDAAAPFQWARYCFEESIGHADAELVPEKVQDFLSKYREGALDAVELAPEETIRQLSDATGTHPSVMWQFKEFCSKAAFGIRRTRFMPVDVIDQFLDLYSGGAVKTLEMASDDVVIELDQLKKKAGAQWNKFCDTHSFGIREPVEFPASVAQFCLENFKPEVKKREGPPPKVKKQMTYRERLQKEANTAKQWRPYS